MVLLVLVRCNEVPSEHREFFRSGSENIEKAIFDYPLEQQIDLMIIGWTKTHSPLNLFFQVAQNGEPIVPLLIQRLSSLKDMEAFRVVVVCVYEVDLRHFKWTIQQNYVNMFEKTINERSDPPIQQEVRAILETGKLHPYSKGLKH